MKRNEIAFMIDYLTGDNSVLYGLMEKVKEKDVYSKMDVLCILNKIMFDVNTLMEAMGKEI